MDDKESLILIVGDCQESRISEKKVTFGEKEGVLMFSSS